MKKAVPAVNAASVLKRTCTLLNACGWRPVKPGKCRPLALSLVEAINCAAQFHAEQIFPDKPDQVRDHAPILAEAAYQELGKAIQQKHHLSLRNGSEVNRIECYSALPKTDHGSVLSLLKATVRNLTASSASA